jgi:hypothetical protein
MTNPIPNMIRDLAIQVMDKGSISPEDSWVIGYEIEAALNEFKEAVKDSVISNVSRTKGGLVVSGLSLAVRPSAGKWDYSGCKVVMDRQALFEKAKELAQTQAKNGGFVATPDGEVIEGASYTPGADTVFVTKAKQPQ